MDSQNQTAQICVLYARVSTEDQAEKYGLPSQVRALHAYAEQHGYKTLDVCSDDGYSGENLERPALTKVRELVRRGLVHVVVAYEPDRLARSLVHQLILQQELEKVGVRHEYVTMAFPDNHEGKLMLNIKGVIAEYEKEKIKERTMRGRKEKAHQGLIVGGRRTYGYRVENGRYVPCEQEMEVVRNIFRWFVEDSLSLRQVVTRLNERGWKPHTGQRWGKSTVNRILTNESYIGKAYFNRRKRISSLRADINQRNKKTRHQWKPEQDWITVAVPPLIDHATFLAAQARMAKHREQKSGRPAKHPWLLRGIIKCGKCGRRYAGYPSHSTLYYRCGGADKISTHPCDAPRIVAKQIENLVLNDLKSILTNPRMLEAKLFEAARAERNLDGELDAVNKQITANLEREAKLLDAYLDETLPGPSCWKKFET